MKQYKILIIEDDRSLAELTRMNFPQDRFIPKTCHSGPEALEAAAADKPDLIILDVMMPVMDGWEVLERLKADPQTASIPVIMCTAKDSVPDVEKSYGRGAVSYLIKPLRFEKLLNKVKEILNIENLLSE